MHINERAIQFQSEVESNPSLSNFVSLVRSTNTEQIILHQDAFAADYQAEEFMLLGKAIKYAGLFGRSILVQGRNRETLQRSK